jgi:lipopolysaccharide/colanic/teichoic acid biosynthesis glycosyltransferase
MYSNRNKAAYSPYLHSRTKRCFDIVMCLFLFFPVLVMIGLLGLTVLIKEGRPVFFKHLRVGRDGKLFWLLKLRTLHVKADPYKSSPKTDHDPLITRTGRVLRKYRLDELPQFFSVLRGQMSIVGPRPELLDIVATYKSLHRKRLAAKPGITGLWQIRGNRRKAIHEEIKYDLYYLRKASLWLDIRILIITIPFVLNLKVDHYTYENRIYTYNFSLSK